MTEHNWQTLANHERARLLAAFGEIPTGGVVENIQHIGATSVPGLPAQFALAVHPFPLDADRLAALGYAITPAHTEFEQRAQHTTEPFALFICEVGSDEWTHYLLVRDYLRASAAARDVYAAHATGGEPGAALTSETGLFAELLDAAQRWWPAHCGFGPVERVVQELQDFDAPWFISSGWALDLFLGRVTRVHHDVDVVIARADQLVLQRYMTARGWRFVTPLQGVLEPWPAHMRLELPRHQAHAHRDGEFIDFLLTDFTAETWRYRRNPAIIRRVEQATQQSPAGIPYLAPELVLLFKSKNTGTRARRQDDVDFENTREQLSAEARAWLRWALIATEPDHPWIGQLA